MFDSNFLNSLFLVESSADLAEVIDHGRCAICGGLGIQAETFKFPFGLKRRLISCCPEHGELIRSLAKELGGEL